MRESRDQPRESRDRVGQDLLPRIEKALSAALDKLRAGGSVFGGAATLDLKFTGLAQHLQGDPAV